MNAEITNNNDQFISRLFKFALPLVMQYLIVNCLNLVDNIMIGSLGEISISGVGLGNQVFFLTNLFMFGITGGATIFMAQYWGKKDIDSIHKTMGLSVILTFIIAAVFTTAGTVFAKQVISIYTPDPLVIAEGSRYLNIAALSYVPFSISIVLVTAFRTTGNIKVPMITSIIALSLNTFFNYCLIFGNFGFPQLGVEGAAIATTLARTVETILLIAIMYSKRFDIAAPVTHYFALTKDFVIKILQKISLVLLNEATWALGTTIYSVIYGRMSTISLTIMNICGVVFNVAFVFALSIGHALGIMIGNSLGAKNFERAKRDARRGIPTGFIVGAVVAVILILLRSPILSFFNVDNEVIEGAKTILLIMLIILPINCIEFTLFIGILRAGGDTTFCAAADIGALWLIGLPLAYSGAFIFALPLMFVYMLARMESLSRTFACYLRYRSFKWVKDIT